jgi:TolB-like protein/DNA-binding winged helix-turn-helix (wHTH) protein
MPESTQIRFGEFEVNLRAGEIRKRGIKLKIAEQPFQVLAALLEKPGEVVTREELRQKLWPDGTFVDFDHGLTKAVNRIRDVLGDSAESPRYVETLPRRGYRFVGVTDMVNGSGSAGETASAVAGTAQASLAIETQAALARNRRRLALAMAVGAVVLLAAGLWLSRQWNGLWPSNQIRTVAVLPLENLSHDPQDDYFADGMTDELITTLAKISALHVISRSSVLQYKAKKSMREMARQLGVDSVVEGTVLRSGERVRITVRLIDARTDTHIWAESYQRYVRDVLSLQSEITRAIADAIRVKLSPQEKTRLAHAPQVAPEAQEAYLKGRYYWNKVSDGGCEKGIEYFNEAIRKAPDYAAAYAGLADCYAHLNIFGALPATDAFPKAKEAAAKGISLDDSLAEAHAILGSVLFLYDWNWQAAESEYERSIELNSSYAPVHMYYAGLLIVRHEKERALAELRKARTFDPLGQMTNIAIAYQLNLAREYDQAIQQLHRILELYPDLDAAHFFLAMNYRDKGLPAQAFEELMKAQTLSGATPDQLAALRHAYEQSGMRGIFKISADELVAASKHEQVKAWAVAETCANAGETELALRYLEQAYREREGMTELTTLPCFDSLRADARFQDLIRRVGLP